MKRILPALLLASTIAYAQIPINSGLTYTLESSALEGPREIQVYTPAGYQESNKSYPVLYLLDGQRWFLQAVSYQKLFQEYSYTPDFIVVGINTGDSGRYGFFSRREKLTDFLEKDVIAFVEENFRTTQERLLFGWQFAGAFTLQTLFNRSELFSGYLAASPIPINADMIDEAQVNLESKSLFIVSSHLENQVNDGVSDFVTKLKNTTTPLKWSYKKVEWEDISSFGHRTTPLSTLYHGLRFYYGDYTLLEFDQLEDFNHAGGYDYVKAYYQARAEKYNLPSDIPQEGMFFLLRLGLDANDYPVFQTFMVEFIDKGVLDDTNLGWGTRYAEFSLQNEDYPLAKSIYQGLRERFPDNARPVHGLGKVSLALGDRRDAKKLFESAIEMAKKTNDRRLDQYQADLDSIK